MRRTTRSGEPPREPNRRTGAPYGTAEVAAPFWPKRSALVSDPVAAQSFTSQSAATFRYIQFLPTSVASVNPSCCGANVYGLNELRVFGSATPEPTA